MIDFKRCPDGMPCSGNCAPFGGCQRDARPAAPESETPLVLGLQDIAFALQKEGSESWAIICREAATALSLAQTEIKGHMRVVDELKRTLHDFGMKVGDAMLKISHALKGDPEKDIFEGSVKAAEQAQSRISELEKDAARLNYLEREMELEQELIQRGKGTDPMYPSLFRRNMPITRAAIDAALKSRA